MRPRYKELIKDNLLVNLEEIDFDDNPQLVKQYAIGDVLPVAIIFSDDGQEIKRIVGEVTSKKLHIIWSSL